MPYHTLHWQLSAVQIVLGLLSCVAVFPCVGGVGRPAIHPSSGPQQQGLKGCKGLISTSWSIQGTRWIAHLSGKVHTLLWLPGVLVSLGLAVPCRTIWAALHLTSSLEPPLVLTIIWFSIQLVTPLLVHLYISRTLRARAAVVAGASTEGSGSLDSTPGVRPPELDDDDSIRGEHEQGSNGNGANQADGAGSVTPRGEGMQLMQRLEDTRTANQSQQQQQGARAEGTNCHPELQDDACVYAFCKPVEGGKTDDQQVPEQELANPAGLSPAAVYTQLLAESSSGERAPKGSRRPSLRRTQTLSPAHVVYPTKDSLQGLQNAKNLVARATTLQSYRSRLVQPQVIIKMENAEPQQLDAGLVEAANGVLQAKSRSNLLVTRACARRGCTLLTFNLVAASSTQDAGPLPTTPVQHSLSRLLSDSSCGCGQQCAGDTPPYARRQQLGVDAVLGSELSSQADLLDAAAMQAWLQTLLPPGTDLPDGSVAHISVDGRELQGTWCQADSSWVVRHSPAVAPALAALAPSVQLLHIDSPVARLCQASPVHPVSLLLQVREGAGVSFVGSDTSAAAPPDQLQQQGAGCLVMHCVARGQLGECLPVEVAGHEQVSSEQVAALGGGTNQPATHASTSSLVKLQLQVGLTHAISVGAVQLELWSGRFLLASAPLLLLPALPACNKGGRVHDDLLEELQLSLQSSCWDAPAGNTLTEPSSHAAAAGEIPAGLAAFLTDLGQVLATAECVQSAEQEPGNSSEYVATGPGSWGGIRASLKHQHACNTALLTTVLHMADGLLEYAQAQGLTCTGQLVATAVDTLQQRVAVLSMGHGSLGPSLPTAGAASTASEPHSTSLRARPTHAIATSSAEQHQAVASASSSVKPVNSAGSSRSSSRNTSSRIVFPPSFNLPQQLTARQAIRAVVLGFKPAAAEQQYARWLSERCRGLVCGWSLNFVGWMIACWIRSAQQGDFFTHALIHCTCIAPYLLSAILTFCKQDRLQERMLLGHGVGRSLAAAMCLYGVLPRHMWPNTYCAGWRTGLDVWGEIAMHSPGEPMRLPYLLAANFLALGFSFGFGPLCGHAGWSPVPRVLVARGGAVVVGLALDLWRRAMFVKECAYQQSVQAARLAAKQK